MKKKTKPGKAAATVKVKDLRPEKNPKGGDTLKRPGRTKYSNITLK